MSDTKSFVVRAAYALAIVIALCITMFGTRAEAQDLSSPRQGHVTLNESLDFTAVYNAIVRQVPEDDFETCARWGRNCPPTRRFPSANGVVPRRLREIPALERDDILSPGEVGQALLDADALSARCYQEESGPDGAMRLVGHQARLHASTLRARTWDPRHWVRGCKALSLKVRAGRSFVYTVLDTQATRTLGAAANDLLGENSPAPAVFRSTSLQVLRALDEADPPSVGSLVLFVRTLLDKILTVFPSSTALLSNSPAVAKPGGVIHTSVPRRTTSFSGYDRTTLFTWVALTAVTLLSLVLLVVAWVKNGRLRKALSAYAQTQESFGKTISDLQTSLDTLKLLSLRLAGRLLERLDESDARRSRYIDAQGRRDPLKALQDADDSLDDLLRMVYNKGAEGEAAKRDVVEAKNADSLRKLLQGEVRDDVVAVLERLGCEVKDPQAELVAIITRVVHEFKEAKASMVLVRTPDPSPRATLEYGDHPAGTRAGPAPEEVALGQLAGFAAMIIRLNDEEEGGPATPSMTDPQLAAKATAAFGAIQARRQKAADVLSQAVTELEAQAGAREKLWNDWADDLRCSLARLVAFAQDAVALFDAQAGEPRNHAVDFVDELYALYSALDKMRDCLFEALRVEADIDSFLPPPQEPSETRRNVPVTVKFAALMAYLGASKSGSAPASS